MAHTNSTHTSTAYTCAVCNAVIDADMPRHAVVHCNVRQFANHRFTVWQCPRCRCIHALEPVELDDYYRAYPYQSQTADPVWKLIAANFLKRLKRAGLKKHHAVLDFGCGSALLVNALKRTGYRNVVGYEPYDDAFSNPAALEKTYDTVICQDVIEHVDNPHDLLDRIVDLTRPGGIICIGSPNADQLDLARPDHHKHSLHQPFHRHILSLQALKQLAEDRELTVERCYTTYYADTFIPFINARFWRHYGKLFDDTMNLAFEPVKLSAKLLTPKSLTLACLGRLYPPKTEMMLLLKKPRTSPPLPPTR